MGWQVPDDARVLRFSAVVDRGLEITEGDETNNELEELVAINERKVDSGDDAQGLLSGQAAVIGIAVIAAGLVGLLVFLMPPKIKKIE
ncbi:MAG: hypothetical protein CM15mP78_08940 [Candidatus Poseidoniales archaeon]|nr:MAG: hypothetical protein CM15mP78_08940 [Candidatus Poseidoniales archaeon]